MANGRFTLLAAAAVLLAACFQETTLAKRVMKRDQHTNRLPSEERFNYFDLELLQSVASTTEGNILISPVSTKATLAMLLEGAGGATADQIRMALRLPENLSATQNLLRTYLSNLLTEHPGYKVALSNRVFMSKVLEPNERFQSSLRTYYFADVEKVDFTSPELTSRKINEWVRTTTKGLIPQLVDPGMLQPDSQVLLANAIYFKGKWKTQFDTQGTIPRCFYIAPDVCRNANMMETLGEYGYAYVKRLDAYALELPYVGDKFSMLIVMPNQLDGMTQLVRDMLHVPLRDIADSLQTSEVLVSVPRFTIDYSTDLVATLHKLGIRDMFGPLSNLGGLFAGSEASAQVSNVIHKAKIIVNEEGSEAAAATGAQVIPLMGSTTPKFRADRPFLFFLIDTTTRVTLFAGRVTEPEFTRIRPPQSESEQLGADVFTTVPPRRPNNRPSRPYRRTTTPATTTTQGTEVNSAHKQTFTNNANTQQTQNANTGVKGVPTSNGGNQLLQNTNTQYQYNEQNSRYPSNPQPNYQSNAAYNPQPNAQTNQQSKKPYKPQCNTPCNPQSNGQSSQHVNAPYTPSTQNSQNPVYTQNGNVETQANNQHSQNQPSSQRPQSETQYQPSHHQTVANAENGPIKYPVDSHETTRYPVLPQPNRYQSNSQNVPVALPLGSSETQQHASKPTTLYIQSHDLYSQNTKAQQLPKSDDVLHLPKERDNQYISIHNYNVPVQVVNPYLSYIPPPQSVPVHSGPQNSQSNQYDSYLTKTRDSFQASGGGYASQQRVPSDTSSSDSRQQSSIDRDAIVFTRQSQ